MDFFFRFATDAYGRTILLGANWDTFWWFVAAGFLFIALHAISVPLLERHRAEIARRPRRK
jgi:hypothetical protein